MVQSRLAPKDGDTRPCPECRGTLVFRSRHPVLSIAMMPPHGSERDRIRYEAAWVCENGECEYREPFEADGAAAARRTRESA